MLCVDCKQPKHGEKIEAAVAPQVESLEKLAPGLKKGKKAKRKPDTKEETLTKPTLKAPIV